MKLLSRKISTNKNIVDVYIHYGTPTFGEKKKVGSALIRELNFIISKHKEMV